MAGKTRIGQFLKAKGSSQNEAAKLLGISPCAFSLKANGFSEEEVGKLAKHYKMTEEEVEDVLR